MNPLNLWIWNAFVDLNAQRHTIDGYPQPLNFADIHAYFCIKMFTCEEMAAGATFIQALDKVYVETRNKQITDERKRQAQRKRGGGRGR